MVADFLMPIAPIRLKIPRRSVILSRCWAIFLIPAALTYTFGAIVKDTRQGWALLATMFGFFLVGVLVLYSFRSSRQPQLCNPEHFDGDARTQ